VLHINDQSYLNDQLSSQIVIAVGHNAGRTALKMAAAEFRRLPDLDVDAMGWDIPLPLGPKDLRYGVLPNGMRCSVSGQGVMAAALPYQEAAAPSLCSCCHQVLREEREEAQGASGAVPGSLRRFCSRRGA
jgi:hypothetical protein